MIRKEHETILGTTGAEFSDCLLYRYTLWRQWGDGPVINFLMLNPSTANETANDPTVERCQRRAEQLGFEKLIVTNLFAFRATDPKAMKAAADPIGPGNNAAILDAAATADATVFAWGQHGRHLKRSAAVAALLREKYPQTQFFALKVADNGEPHHPLYLPYELKPTPFPVAQNSPTPAQLGIATI